MCLMGENIGIEERANSISGMGHTVAARNEPWRREEEYSSSGDYLSKGKNREGLEMWQAREHGGGGASAASQ